MSYTKTGRSSDLLAGLAYLDGTPDPVIVEVGSTRDTREAARWSDGWATLTFLEYTEKHGGAVHTVDVKPRLDALRTVTGRHFPRLTTHVADVLSWNGWPSRVDAIYLDGPNEAAPHLHATTQAVARGCELVIFDDVVEADYGPKATTAVPYLEALGWRIVVRGERVLAMTTPERAGRFG